MFTFCNLFQVCRSADEICTVGKTYEHMCLFIAATTSLGASVFTVIRSCLAVALLYGLCYAGLRVRSVAQ